MSEINQIKQDEGFRSTLYYCSLGKPTIGYGFNLKSGITEEEASAILAIRVNRITEELKALLHWFPSLPDEVQGVLVNMAYQLGVSGTLKFTKTMNFAQSGEWDAMATEMLRSGWAIQTPHRANRLAHRVRNVGSSDQ